MHEFLATCAFSLIPLLTIGIFSIITPPFGATLSLRNEILLGIALPPVGTAIIAAAVLAGVHSDSRLILYGITAVALFLILISLPLNVGKKRTSFRRRELVLAGLFCLGNTLTMLFMSISRLAEANFNYLLQGELLAVNKAELTVIAVFSAIVLAVSMKLRGVLYAYALDEEGLFIKEKSYRSITLIYRALVTLIVTGGIVLIGPLLTTALLIIPPFLCEKHSRGLDRFMVLVIAVGLLGTVAGFLLSIYVDLPPGPVIVSVVTVFGLCVRLLPSKT